MRLDSLDEPPAADLVRLLKEEEKEEERELDGVLGVCCCCCGMDVEEQRERSSANGEPDKVIKKIKSTIKQKSVSL